ncbi:hypothetical protein ACFPM0_18235 [Pseudonocardia sulfidoxydans]|uniref:hypothetical protein n=1 Tax=Pseudonocardia sulfidoxydans TaxID=54011 RepID=UPI003622F1A2
MSTDAATRRIGGPCCLPADVPAAGVPGGLGAAGVAMSSPRRTSRSAGSGRAADFVVVVLGSGPARGSHGRSGPSRARRLASPQGLVLLVLN